MGAIHGPYLPSRLHLLASIVIVNVLVLLSQFLLPCIATYCLYCRRLHLLTITSIPTATHLNDDYLFTHLCHHVYRYFCNYLCMCCFDYFIMAATMTSAAAHHILPTIHSFDHFCICCCTWQHDPTQFLATTTMFFLLLRSSQTQRAASRRGEQEAAPRSARSHGHSTSCYGPATTHGHGHCTGCYGPATTNGHGQRTGCYGPATTSSHSPATTSGHGQRTGCYGPATTTTTSGSPQATGCLGPTKTPKAAAATPSALWEATGWQRHRNGFRCR